jgi:hypothetical protein
MNGGDAIASGSQACIFRPRLNTKRMDSRIIAFDSPLPTDKNYVTKVFFDQATWKHEVDILLEISKRLGEDNPGIVDVIGYSEANLLASIIPPHVKGTGCQKVSAAAKAGKKIYLMHQTYILGDIRDLTETKPLMFFQPALEVLIKLTFTGIVHLDIAMRNIFFNSTSAMIGDFGYAIDMTLDSEFDEMVNKYCIENIAAASTPIRTSLMMALVPEGTGITREAALAMLCYSRWEVKNALVHSYFNDELDSFRKDLDDIVPGYSSVVDSLMKTIGDLSDKDSMKGLLQNILKHSDLKLFIQNSMNKCNINVEEKNELLKQVFIHANYRYFYTLLGKPAAKSINAQIPTSRNKIGLPILGAYNHIDESNLDKQLAELQNVGLDVVFGGMKATRRQTKKRKQRRTRKH